MVVELDAMRAESATPVFVFEFACEPETEQLILSGIEAGFAIPAVGSGAS